MTRSQISAALFDMNTLLNEQRFSFDSCSAPEPFLRLDRHHQIGIETLTSNYNTVVISAALIRFRAVLNFALDKCHIDRLLRDF